MRAAAMHPDREAVAGLSYRELLEKARQFAARGFSPGERVPIKASTADQFAIALHGCLLAGVAAVPIDPRLGEEERAARVGSIQGTTRGVATVMFTSGTTSAPKPVELTYQNWLANALGSAVALGLDQRERWLSPLPLAHVGGLAVLMRSAIYATSAVVHERFELEAVLEALSDPGARITLTSLVPTMLARLLDAGLSNPPTLRWALLGGGPIPSALLERAADAGVPVAPSYGMTEACSQIATNGWPLPGVEVSIAGDGEVLVRGANVASSALAPDGWLHTGDLGSIETEGRLRITGRKADTIVSGGENVAPAEVEAVLLSHPAVADVGVFARADAEWGEAVIAAVVTRDGAVLTAEELRSYCAQRLARFKAPKAVEFVRSLPRTPSGKLLRGELG